MDNRSTFIAFTAIIALAATSIFGIHECRAYQVEQIHYRSGSIYYDCVQSCRATSRSD